MCVSEGVGEENFITLTKNVLFPIETRGPLISLGYCSLCSPLISKLQLCSQEPKHTLYFEVLQHLLCSHNIFWTYVEQKFSFVQFLFNLMSRDKCDVSSYL